jgi:chitinase
MNPEHIYTKSGKFTVTLTVVDNNGRSDLKTTTVDISTEVYNYPPIPDIGGPYVGIATETIIFDASESYDTDGTITEYIWEFGDGISANGASPTHVYTDSGAYAVNLTVQDDFGAEETTSIIVIVNESTQGTPGFEVMLVLSSFLILALIKKKKK